MWVSRGLNAEPRMSVVLATGAILVATVFGMSAAKSLAAPFDASTGVDWLDEVAIPGVSAGHGPVAAFDAAGSIWAVWEDGVSLRSARRSAAGEWSATERVAGGYAAAIAIGDGVPHVAFAAEIADRHDIFYTWREAGRWALPRNVSDTVSLSGSPSIAFVDGIRAIAWADGERLYIGRSSDGDVWTRAPVMINGVPARGRAPVITGGRDGDFDLTWETVEADGPRRIVHAVWHDGRWSVAEELSDTPSSMAPSAPRMVRSQKGERFVAWREGQAVQLVAGVPGLWGWPENVESAGATVGPSIALGTGTDAQEAIVVAWRGEGGTARLRRRDAGGTWRDVTTAGAAEGMAPTVIATGERLALIRFVTADGGSRTLRVRSGSLSAAAPTPTAGSTIEPTSAVSPSATVTPTPAESPVPTSTTEPTISVEPSPTGPTVEATAIPTATGTPPEPAPTIETPPIGSTPGGSATPPRTIHLPWLDTGSRPLDSAEESAKAMRILDRPNVGEITDDRDPKGVAGRHAFMIDGVEIAAKARSAVLSPAAALGADGSVHVLWDEGGDIMHIRRETGDVWSTPRRVARGDSPSIALGADGLVHAVFANTFGGVRDVFHVRFDGAEWSLPINVSATLGHSAGPSVIAGPSAAEPIVAAWAEIDRRPRVHVARWDGERWHHGPIPQASGQGPAVARTDLARGLAVTWHARREDGSRDVLYTARSAGAWGIPEIVSGPEGGLTPAIGSAPATESVHVVWRIVASDGDHAAHSERDAAGWRPILRVGDGIDVAPGLSVRGADRVIVWSREGILWRATGLGARAWSIRPIPATAGARAAIVVIGADRAGHLVWTDRDEGGARVLYATWRACGACSLWIPFASAP